MDLSQYSHDDVKVIADTQYIQGYPTLNLYENGELVGTYLGKIISLDFPFIKSYISSLHPSLVSIYM